MHERGDQRRLGGVEVEALDERAVELDDLRAYAHHLLQPGIAATGVVDRDPRAAGAQARESRTQLLVLGDALVLGDLDDQAVQPLGEHGLYLLPEHRRGTEVERGRAQRAGGTTRRMRSSARLTGLPYPSRLEVVTHNAPSGASTTARSRP